jgi:DNA-binding LytR/AlgR family response regulator
MKALIAEDETLAGERLLQMIHECDPSIHVQGRLDSVDETVKFFRDGNETDLLFLDIQLADGKSFEIFDQVKVDVPIIFTTAYNQYALQAFKLHSIDYLLKPVQLAELQRAIDKHKRIYKKRAWDKQEIEMLKSILERPEKEYKERFLIKAGNKLQYKTVSEAAYFFAEGKAAYLVSKKENRKYLIDYSLDELEKQINPNNFFRISRKAIVGIDSIAEIKGLVRTRMEVKLTQPAEVDLTVSRDRAQLFKEWLNK